MIVNIKTYRHNYGVRQRVNVGDSALHSFQLSRQRGFVMRCKYEYEYCKLKNGACYFVTLTYNDNAVISIDGQNYCCNDSFRLLMINKVNKTLQRKFNCSVRYFCCGEMGEGKGERGFDNNPHLHVLYYVYPLDATSKLPNEDEFLKVISDFWRGDSSSPKDAPFGIVSYSNKGALVESDKAMYYVAKYCVKDSNYKHKFDLLLYSVLSRVKFDDFYYSPTLSEVSELATSIYSSFNKKILSSSDFDAFIEHVNDFIALHFLGFPSYDVFYKFCYKLVMKLSNRLLPKVFISKGFGLYGLDFVKDWSNPKLPYVVKNGESTMIKHFPIPLYYFRKKFCTTETYVRNGKKNVLYKKTDEYINMYSQPEVFNARIQRSVDSLWSLLSANHWYSVPRMIHMLASIGVSVPGRFRNFKRVSSFDITKSDVYAYVVYMSVYFGRNTEVRFRDLASLRSIACNDFRFFLHSDRDAKLSEVPFVDDFPYRSDFRPYYIKFDFLMFFQLYIKYFKNNELIEKSNEWRRLRRAHYSHDYQVDS
ncbi:replication initiator protein [Dipodfec virus UOA04_Rod_558]|nr:replication initiator protein [Dipodfec virus UOA04_Rod_558]